MSNKTIHSTLCVNIMVAYVINVNDLLDLFPLPLPRTERLDVIDVIKLVPRKQKNSIVTSFVQLKFARKLWEKTTFGIDLCAAWVGKLKGKVGVLRSSVNSAGILLSLTYIYCQTSIINQLLLEEKHVLRNCVF